MRNRDIANHFPVVVKIAKFQHFSKTSQSAIFSLPLRVSRIDHTFTRLIESILIETAVYEISLLQNFYKVRHIYSISSPIMLLITATGQNFVT